MSYSLPWRSLLARVCALVFFYGAILLVTAHAQSEKPPEQPSLQDNLTSLVNLSQTLVSRLTERQQQVRDLQESLRQASAQLETSAEYSQDLEQRLTVALESLSSLQMDLQATLSLLAASKASLSQAETSFSAYRVEMQGQVQELERQRNLALLGGGAVALALIAALILK